MGSTLPSWYARRPYIHFDLPLSPLDAAKYVRDPKRVESHAFYPLLAYDLVTPRIRKSQAGTTTSFIKDPKHRNIAYPAHKDGYIFSYYKSMLELLYENWLKTNGLSEAVTAFRGSTHENNVTLAKKAFEFIKANPGCRIVATDVESFFDTINHDKLKETWAYFFGAKWLPGDHYAVYKAVTQYSVVPRHKVYNLFKIPLSSRQSQHDGTKRLCTPKQFRAELVPRRLIEANPGLQDGAGIPQGVSLSPLLSNMYMYSLDLAMHTWVRSLGGSYWRYCDDILIVVPRGKRTPILGRLDKELKSLGLKRSKTKTHDLTSSQLESQKQLQYLGFIFNGNEALVRPSSIHRYHRKLKKAIRAAELRRDKDGEKSGQKAPLRQRALYNMYSELPIRGVKINARKRRQKYRGNFTHYMARSAEVMDSRSIEQQRRKILKKFRTDIQKHK